MTLIAIHLLQNHAPSNLNRDDNGDPKDCLFGGFRRARISSQALKRSIRTSAAFRAEFVNDEHETLEELDFTKWADLLARRTRLLPESLRPYLQSKGVSDEEQEAIVQVAAQLGKREQAGKEKESDARRKTPQLMFLSKRELSLLADELIELCRQQGVNDFSKLKTDDVLKELKRVKPEQQLIPHTVDIAMFGRMTTSSPFKNIEASVQVAHALSTHTVTQEFDYYTAVDDISGETGAGFIGELSFNSATYYKYVNIHWEGLVDNLGGDKELAARAVRAFIRAAMLAIQSGKQNTFAAHNLPDVALVEVRAENVPLSYANAFLTPVRANSQESLIEASAQALLTYIANINGKYELSAQRAFLSTVKFDLVDASQCATLNDLLAWLPVGAQEE